MKYDARYFNDKYEQLIKKLPHGGEYRFDIRQHCYDIIKDNIKAKSKVFDYGCGLGHLITQLEKEKDCKVSGCDFSSVAIDYVKTQCKGKFMACNEVFGEKYDVVTAVYLLEHIKNPDVWVKETLGLCKEIIVAIPHNFNKSGEHQNMAWGSWDEFFKLFKDFKFKRLDEGKYSSIPTGFKHPIFSIKAKGWIGKKN